MKIKIKTNEVLIRLAKKNMSQNDLAYHLRTASGYMSQLLTGKRHPSPKFRIKMMKFFKEKDFDSLFVIDGM